MSQDMMDVMNDVPEYMNELIPYRCPKCGHLRRFATLRELRQHLQHDHAFQMGFVKPHTRANIFDSDTKASPRSETHSNSNRKRYGARVDGKAMFDDFNSNHGNDKLKSLKNESFIRDTSPLLQSYKDEANVLELELQRAKQNEIKHKTSSMTSLSQSTINEDLKAALEALEKDTVTVKEAAPVSMSFGRKPHPKALIDSLQNEMIKSSQTHMETVEALNQSQEVLQHMGNAAEEKCRQQREIIQRLTQGVKEKENKLEETSRERSSLREERQRLFEETERLVREADHQNSSLKSELEKRGKTLEVMNEELVRLKSISERELRSKDNELQTAREKMERLTWERNELMAETDKILQQADRDSEVLRHNIRVREGQLESVNRELEKQRQSQQTLIEQTMTVHRKAEESTEYMKDVVNEKDGQLRVALEQLERMRSLQIQLTEESHALTDQADENTATMRRLLLLKEEQVKDVMKQLDILRSEKHHLESNTVSLAEEARSSSSTISSLQGMVKRKEADLKDTQSELHQLKTFLRSATQTEKVARQKMETFIDDLISRAEKAESELRMLRSASSSSGLDSGSLDKPKQPIADAARDFQKEHVDAIKHSLRARVSPPKPPRNKMVDNSANQQSLTAEQHLLKTTNELPEVHPHVPITSSVPSSGTRSNTTITVADVHQPMLHDRRDISTSLNQSAPYTRTENDAVIDLLNRGGINSQSKMDPIKDQLGTRFAPGDEMLARSEALLAGHTPYRPMTTVRSSKDPSNFPVTNYLQQGDMTVPNGNQSAFLDKEALARRSYDNGIHQYKTGNNANMRTGSYAPKTIYNAELSLEDNIRNSGQYPIGHGAILDNSNNSDNVHNQRLNYINRKLPSFVDKRPYNSQDMISHKYAHPQPSSLYTHAMGEQGNQNYQASQRHATYRNNQQRFMTGNDIIYREDELMHSGTIPETMKRYDVDSDSFHHRPNKQRDEEINNRLFGSAFQRGLLTFHQSLTDTSPDRVGYSNFRIRPKQDGHDQYRYKDIDDQINYPDVDQDSERHSDSEYYTMKRPTDTGGSIRHNKHHRAKPIPNRGFQQIQPNTSAGRSRMADVSQTSQRKWLNNNDYTESRANRRSQRGNNRYANDLPTREEEAEYIRNYPGSRRPVAIGRSPDIEVAVKPNVSRRLKNKGRLINPDFATEYPSSHKSMADLHNGGPAKSRIRDSNHVQDTMYRRSRSLSPLSRRTQISGLTNDEIGKYRETVRKKREAYVRGVSLDAQEQSDENYDLSEEHQSSDEEFDDTDDNFNNIMDENGILWADDMDTLPDVSDAELDRVSPSGSEAIATKKTNTTTVHTSNRVSPFKQVDKNVPQTQTQGSAGSKEVNKVTARRSAENSYTDRTEYSNSNKLMRNPEHTTDILRGLSPVSKRTSSRLSNKDKVGFRLNTEKTNKGRTSDLFRPIKSPKEVRNSLSDKDMSSGGKEVNTYMRHSPKSFTESVNIKSYRSSSSTGESSRQSASKSVSNDNETLEEKLKRISEKYKSQRSDTSTSSGKNTVEDKMKNINDKYKKRRNDILAGKGVMSMNAITQGIVSPRMDQFHHRSSPNVYTGKQNTAQNIPNTTNVSYSSPNERISQSSISNSSGNNSKIYSGQTDFRVHPWSSTSMPTVHHDPQGDPNLFLASGYRQSPYNSYIGPLGQQQYMMPGMTAEHFQQIRPPAIQPHGSVPDFAVPPNYQTFAHPLYHAPGQNTGFPDRVSNVHSFPQHSEMNTSAANQQSGFSNSAQSIHSDISKTVASNSPHSLTNSAESDLNRAQMIPSVTVSGDRNINVPNQSPVNHKDLTNKVSDDLDIEGMNSESPVKSIGSRRSSNEIKSNDRMKPMLHVQAVRSPTPDHHMGMEEAIIETERASSTALRSERSTPHSSEINQHNIPNSKYSPDIKLNSENFKLNSENLLQARTEDLQRAKSAGEIEEYSETFEDYSRSAGEVSQSLRMSSGSLSSADMSVSKHSGNHRQSLPLEEIQNKSACSVSEGFSLFAEPIEDDSSIAGCDSNTQSLLDLRGNMTDTDLDTDTESGRRGDITGSRIRDAIDNSHSDYSDVYRMKSNRNVTSSASSQASIDLLERIPLSRREEVKRRRQGLSCIFSFLDTHSLCRVAEVCREWKIVGRSAKVWQRIELRNEKVSPKFLLYLAKRCSQLKVLVLEDLRPRTRRKSETTEQYQASIRASLEGPFEQILKKSESTLHTISIVNCGELFTAKSLWTASCHSRMLRHVTYLSDTDPINNEVMWALGSGCRDLKTLQIHPIIPCKRPQNFNTRCAQLVGKCFPDLETLSIGGPDVDVTALIFIVKQCQLLRTLELDHMSLIPEDIVEKMCDQGLDNLKTIRFVATPVASEGLLKLKGRCEHLEEIVVHLSKEEYFSGIKQPETAELYEEQVRKYDALRTKSAFRKTLKLHVDRSLKMALNNCIFD